MAESPRRQLIETRRRVTDDRCTAYDLAWSALRSAVEEQGAKAWRFRSRNHAGAYVEFIEFKEGDDPRGAGPVEEAALTLDQISPGVVEELVDATVQREGGE